MFRLYYAPGTCALATHIALEEAGAPYEAVLVDFGTQSQRSAEYLAVNPKGRVPALVTESGTLTETPSLLCFVAQRFPKAELAPLADPFALARVQEFNSYLCSTVHVAHAHGRRGSRWADDAAAIEAMKRKVPANVTECFGLIEHKLMKGPWVMGDQYTICDPYLFTIASWMEGDGVDTTKLPRVMEHRPHAGASGCSKGCGCRRDANSLMIGRASNGSTSAGRWPAATRLSVARGLGSRTMV